LSPKRAGLRVGASQLLAHHVIGMSASALFFCTALSRVCSGTPIPGRSARFQKRCVSEIAQSMHLHLSIDLA
jgi:hypothetical protein